MKKQSAIILSVSIIFLLTILTSISLAFTGYNKSSVTEKGLELSFISNLKSKIDWEYKNFEMEIERKFIGVGVANSIGNSINLYGSLNYIYDGEVNHEDFNALNYDSGFFTNIGVKMNSYNENKISVFVYGQINYIFSDDWSYSDYQADFKFENSGIELSVGAYGKYSIDKAFSIFGGLELVPYSDIEGELIEDIKNGGRISYSDDYERESFFSLKIGAEYSFEKFDKKYNVASEISFGNEQAFTLSVCIPM